MPSVFADGYKDTLSSSGLDGARSRVTATQCQGI